MGQECLGRRGFTGGRSGPESFFVSSAPNVALLRPHRWPGLPLKSVALVATANSSLLCESPIHNFRQYLRDDGRTVDCGDKQWR